MLPWRIRLSKSRSVTDDGTNGALMSSYEIRNRHRGQVDVLSKAIEPRNMLFGLNGMALAPQQVTFKGQQQAVQNVQKQHQMQQMYVQQQRVQQPHPLASQQQSGLFGSNNTTAHAASYDTLFGSSTNVGDPSLGGSHALQDHQMQLVLLEQQNKKRLLMARQEQDKSSGAGGHGKGFDDFGAETIIADLPTLDTQESEWNDSGYVQNCTCDLYL